MAPGDRLTLNFSLALPDGVEIDSNFDSEAVSLIIGSGDMLKGFEEALENFKPGERCTAVVPAEKAFGQHNPLNLQEFTSADFADGMTLEEGLVVGFSDAAGGELPGVISSIEGDKIVVDFNHPLAGRDIVFTAQIHSIQPAA